ncbi:MAG: hypothetical protein NZM43_13190 [Saprospiraceae bacterium]|nr:hypothetical protein [Saprospiraceae bacterium]MDW8485269.1 hypothetical protein [Saprospiraceae bacterium]
MPCCFLRQRFLWWASALVWTMSGAVAQRPMEAALSNLRWRVIDAQLPIQALDSLTIASELVAVCDSATNQKIDSSICWVENNLLHIDTARLFKVAPHITHLKVAYRVLPLNLAQPMFRLDTAIIRRAGKSDNITYDYRPFQPVALPWETATLRTNGAYVRGIGLGNNQNLTFNSNLNLQLEGRLGNDIEVVAAVSDNSIPLQPDGTTRRLQEFDRIFIQLRRQQTTLSAGDLDLTRPNGYFLNYFKRVQGAMLHWQGAAAGKPDIRTAFSVSRGKFQRQTINGQEGNQGPYRLQGANGERFIVVLAGTEKVFLDGVLLRRGLEDDYVIDYNLGELTFTHRRLISKDSRIIVEFEYAVQTYLRSTAIAEIDQKWGPYRVYFHAYTEQDSRTSSAARDLTPDQIQRLAEVGNDVQKAYTSGVDTLRAEAALDPTRVWYAEVDTVVCGQKVRFLRYTTDPTQARFTARFTEVPPGQGNYVQETTGANGRVFRWVPPDPITCQPQGNFEPIVRLVAPESRQIVAAGGEWKPSARTHAHIETALSHYDRNRFSPLNNKENVSWAIFAHLRQQLLPLTVQPAGWNLFASATYEHTARNFTPLNPYRPPEFSRDWNLFGTDSTAAEHWMRASIALQHQQRGGLRYELGTFTRASQYRGLRHIAQGHWQHDGFSLLLETNVLLSRMSNENARFSRPKLDFHKTFFSTEKKPIFKIGFYGEREHNERRLTANDSLHPLSFWYDLGRAYLEWGAEGNAWRWKGSWMHRKDYAPAGKGFSQNTAVNEANLNGTWERLGSTAGKNTHQLQWNLSWRQLHVKNPELTALKPQETYLGRLDYSASYWKNAISFNCGYEVGSGQTPRIEYTYLRVNPGEGQYTWVDRNQDSVLTLDEIELAIFPDQANYVRISTTTTDYSPTVNTSYNHSLRFEPRMLAISRQKRWLSRLTRLSLQSNLQLSRRILADKTNNQIWNPFNLRIADSALVALSVVSRQALYVNRADPRWDVFIAYTDNRQRTAVVTGAESRNLSELHGHGRLNITPQWTAELDAIKSQHNNNSAWFSHRRFALQSWKLVPKLTWIPSVAFRLSVLHTRYRGKNTLPPADKAYQHSWSAELTWAPAAVPNSRGFRAATHLRAHARLAKVAFEGRANSPAAFVMLEGLQNGRNYLWGIQLERQLSKTMQLSLQYDGRKTGENRTVHNARIQMRAIF